MSKISTQKRSEVEDLKDDIKNLKAHDLEFREDRRKMSQKKTCDTDNESEFIGLAPKDTIATIKDDFQKLVEVKRKYSEPESHDDDFEIKFARNSTDIRCSYIAKLISNGLWSQKSKPIDTHNSIFLYDWDDTLLCTSVLSPDGYFDDNMEVSKSTMTKIGKLEEAVKKLLMNSVNNGDTYIITNSEPGWVEYSCERFFPKCKELLSKLKIISARGLYEDKYPNNSKIWKMEAFKNIVKDYTDKINLPTNIICVGDSPSEIEAGKVLASKFPESFVKTVKFKEKPKIDELTMEVALINDKFNYIYGTCKNWTIKVEKKCKKD